MSWITRKIKGLPGSEPTRKDIDLPLEEGQRRDRRLPAKPRSLGESLGQAAKGYKLLRDRGLTGKRSTKR